MLHLACVADDSVVGCVIFAESRFIRRQPVDVSSATVSNSTTATTMWAELAGWSQQVKIQSATCRPRICFSDSVPKMAATAKRIDVSGLDGACLFKYCMVHFACITTSSP